MSTYPPLPCERITYRAILYPEWKDKNGLPKWVTFKCRRADRDGVSLGLTEARCLRDLETNQGVVTVHVGHVRAVSTAMDHIDVVQDEAEHANITNLPYVYDATGAEIPDIQLKAKAKHLAEQILEHVLEHIRRHS
jgi:hypothetical protein